MKKIQNISNNQQLIQYYLRKDQESRELNTFLSSHKILIIKKWANHKFHLNQNYQIFIIWPQRIAVQMLESMLQSDTFNEEEIINQMEKEAKPEEKDLGEWRKQMDERMIRFLKKQFFELSLTYRLYHYLQTQKTQRILDKNQINYARLTKQKFNEIFHEDLKNLPGFKKQGFALETQTNKEKSAFVVIINNELKEESSLQEIKNYWFEKVKQMFLNDKNNLLTQMYDSNRKRISWIEEKNLWQLKEKYRHSIRSKSCNYGFSQNGLQISHPYLHPESPLESWIFVRLFYKYRRQSMSKSSREMEKKSWTNIETKGSTTPTAEDKNTKNVSCGSHFLMNMTLSEFLQPQKFMSKQDDIPEEEKNSKDIDTKTMKQSPFPTLSTRKEAVNKFKRPQKKSKEAMTKTKTPQRQYLRKELKQSDDEKWNKGKTKISEPQQEQQEAPKKRPRKDSMQMMTVRQYLELNPQYPKQRRPPTE